MSSARVYADLVVVEVVEVVERQGGEPARVAAHLLSSMPPVKK